MKKTLSKRNLVSALILSIVLIAYNILFFVIPFNWNYSKVTYWISYAFTLFFIIAMYGVILLSINDKTLKSRVFGIPIVLTGFFVLLAQLIIDLLLMIIGNWVSIEYWITVLIEVMITASFFISIIAEKAYKEKIIAIDSKGNNNEAFIRELRKELERIKSDISDEQLEKDFEKLYEIVRYTIPVSTAKSYEIEEDISDKFSKLKNQLDNGDNGKAKITIAELISLLKERKAILTK